MPDRYEKLWRQYKRDGDQAAKEELVAAYAHLVHFVLNRTHVVFNGVMQYEDAASHGILGLLEAMDRYDPDRGASFETYCVPRIRGAIRDAARELNWVPRSVQDKAGRVEAATRRLEAELKRPPSREEIAAALNLTEAELAELLSEISPIHLQSLYEVVFRSPGGEEITLEDMVDDPEAVNPVEHVEREALRERLALAIEQLPDREKLVVALYTYEGLTLKEIGRLLGVNESRVCQIHTQAVLRLRARMTGERPGVPAEAHQEASEHVDRINRPERSGRQGSGRRKTPTGAAAQPASTGRTSPYRSSAAVGAAPGVFSARG